MSKQKTSLLIEYHKYQLGRTYPAGHRTDSSNYDPQPLFNAGFQIGVLFWNSNNSIKIIVFDYFRFSYL